MNSLFAGKKILVTGGSGSIGTEIVKQLLSLNATVVRIFSRDETRQVELSETINAGERIRFLIGDVRDYNRLKRAMESIDIVFHAAALKHVPVCEYNPFEAVQTNVIGTQNVLTASREAGVKRVVLISTDKSVSPTNTMGATKLLAERLVQSAASVMGGMILCGVRFGNVLGSRGSLLPLLKAQIREDRTVQITDRCMTRFFMTIGQAVSLVLKSAELACGGEIFVLPMPKIRIVDLIEVVTSEECAALGWDPGTITFNEIGRRSGERYHEELLTKDEAERAFLRDGLVVINPVNKRRPPRSTPIMQKEFRSESGPFLSHEAIAQLVREAAQTVHPESCCEFA